MAHKVTVANPLPAGVASVTLPNPYVNGPGQPCYPGQVIITSDEAFSLIPTYWTTTANSFGVVILADGGAVPS